MLLARYPTTYRRDRLIINTLVLAAGAVWVVGLALHVAMLIQYGSLF